MKTNPVHKVPTHLMEGVEGKEFLVNNRNDEEEVVRVVEEVTEEVLRRTGSAGFSLLCNDAYDSSTLSAERGKENRCNRKLLKESCSEVEVEEWMTGRSGEEERVLIAVSRFGNAAMPSSLICLQFLVWKML